MASQCKPCSIDQLWDAIFRTATRSTKLGDAGRLEVEVYNMIVAVVQKEIMVTVAE